MSGEAPKALREITRKVAEIAKKESELEEAIVEAYRAGMVASTLAKAAGYSDSGLLKLLRRHGVEIRPRGRRAAGTRTDVAYVERAGV